MIPWKLLDRASVPDGGGELRLYQRGDELSIRADGAELMNSRLHASEDALAELACARLAGRGHARVLLGGLGMGFTLAAALARLGATAEVVVAELVPKVIAWNQTMLGHLAGHPLHDARVRVREIDVASVLARERDAYDAVVLDVDNGPESLTHTRNHWLYARAGLRAAFAALRSGGVLGVWSAGPEPAFARRMRSAGFAVDEIAVRARPGRGARHVVWIGTRGPD